MRVQAHQLEVLRNKKKIDLISYNLSFITTNSQFRLECIHTGHITIHKQIVVILITGDLEHKLTGTGQIASRNIHLQTKN